MSVTLWTWLSDFSTDFLTINHYKKPAEIRFRRFLFDKPGHGKTYQGFSSECFKWGSKSSGSKRNAS